MDSICFWLKAEIEKEFEKKNCDFSIIMPTKASSLTKNKGKIFFFGREIEWTAFRETTT